MCLISRKAGAILGNILQPLRLFMQGVCYARAQEQGIAHAQLPIGTYIQMASRKVLAINHGTPEKLSKSPAPVYPRPMVTVGYMYT
jgi:hypothetical protein